MKLSDIDKLVEKLNQHLKDVGAERDKIDDTLDMLQGLKEDCDNACEHILDSISALDRARDALSELV